jgi:multiple sugar transport system ATP-binding protein
MTMASRIAVMKDGILQQIDTPQNLYDHPGNVFVAGFIGSPSMNFFEATLVDQDGKLFVDGGTFKVAVPDNRKATYIAHKGKKIVFGIRPEDIYAQQYAAPGISPAPIKAEVDVSELMGNEIFLYLLSGKKSFIARVDPRTHARPGEVLDLVLNMDNMHVFDPQSEKALDFTGK